MNGVRDALWPGESGRRRGPRPRFTREEVVGAAIRLADSEGLPSATMQRISDDLGAAKMALYRYIPGRAELEALMLDSALGLPEGSDAAADWRAQLLTWARTLRQRMAAHPWTLELTARPRVPGPNELEWFEAGLAALDDTPLVGAEKLDVLAVLTFVVRGSIEQELGGAGPEAALASALEPVLRTHAARFPRTAAAVAEPGTASRQDDALPFGLARVLDGVAALIEQRRTGDEDPAPTE